ncbi:hydroxysqualene dehydroxylase HpnE [Massilia glaciei]|uniref:FAD-dependent oxidoreductase n=1 Tax=Massilia glaciei TaxID=1524097 RepID=A0A2U2HG27_9BURK|nr:hydroxysqualene dehydroxylase HpnE [Massilia glaciei]PWF43678.1 FAD-dependent oxidoreductase [Massilia glaciei]
MVKPASRVAVVGSGWAGCGAAVELARAGCKVTVFEAARSLGGRARGVMLRDVMLDNGQHIMLGAYNETLRLLRHVGIEPKQALLNLPLQMRYAPGSGGMDFVAPRLPAPLHLLVALLRAKGLVREDKMSLARFSSTARWMGWRLDTDCSVSELLDRFDQTERLVKLMWRPLCLAALNTAPERASAQVFLNVLKDSLGAGRAASDMLLPKRDLGSLFPKAAAAYVERHGGLVHLGAKVERITPLARSWRIEASGSALGGEPGGAYDAVVLATAPHATGALLADLELDTVSAQLAAFSYEPITTCYLQYSAGTTLALPFYALIDDGARGHWGQFVFDRGQLDAAQMGLLAVVISASGEAAALGREALELAIAGQLAGVFGRPELATPEWSELITEKRATFACTPALARPANASGLPGLVLAGDYTAGDYPATLESAVRSGILAAKAVLRDARG